MSRRHNVRLLKQQVTYTAPRLAAVLKVNVATVRRWTKEGLLPIDRRRPFLFLGASAQAFLKARAAPRQPLKPGEIYCVACKCPRAPLHDVVSIEPFSASSVTFVGACPECRHRIRRGVRTSEIDAKLGHCTIAYEEESSTIVRGREPAQMSLFEEMSA